MAWESFDFEQAIRTPLDIRSQAIHRGSFCADEEWTNKVPKDRYKINTIKPWYTVDKASEKQIDLLVKLGYRRCDAAALSKHDAAIEISWLRRSQK